MKLLGLILLLTGCLAKEPSLKPGDCVLGTGMALWQLLKEEDGRYMFAQYPVREDTKVTIVDDLRTYKKVECHDADQSP